MERTSQSAQLAKASGGSVNITNDLWHFFYECLKDDLDRVAIISHHQFPNHLAWLVSDGLTDHKPPCLSWTYRQLLSAVDQVVHAFQAHDVPSNTGLLTFIWNSVECHIFFLAAIKLRIHYVPLDPRLLTNTTELDSVLKAVNPGAVIVINEEAARQFDDSSQPTRPNCKAKIILNASTTRPLSSDWSSLSTLTQKARSIPSKPLPPPPSSPSAITTILFTSGTTNRPKGTPHTIENCITESEAHDFRHIHPTSRILLHSPNFRAIFYAWTVCAWRRAACLILAGPTLHPLTSLEVIRAHRATNLTLVPAVWSAIASYPRFEELCPPPAQLEHVGFGGDVVTPALLAKAKARLGATRVVSGLGMTECTGFVGWEGGGVEGEVPTFLGFAGVGRPGRGVKVKICEADGREVLRRGEIGELHLGGQGVIQGYLEGRFEENFYEDEEGRWFKTGDRAVMDEDYVLYVLGRFKDIIKRSGYAISPIVVEGHLDSQPGIKAQVVGMEHKVLGAVPVAVIQRLSVDAPSDAALMELIVNKLGHESSLEYVVSLQELGFEEFPKNDQGKILKSELQRRLRLIHENITK
ncbi:acetyl-CoA synthetase-like protein [Viridothelium virens]|uniref:Acetyl-CoA synthetase-like protein n=1 Tax=Viridothelium virens TaxID=1048519 RepID=A0A6A6GXJ2_VIRVR|nr:acetyl-CoA synthetase-like protein [Viridothelium virens]